MRANRWWGVVAPLLLLASALIWTGASGAQPFGSAEGLQLRFVSPAADVVTEPLRYGTIQVEAHDSSYGTGNGDGIRRVHLKITDDASSQLVARRTEWWPTYDFGPRLPDGTYTLEATAVSRSGERKTITRTLTVNTSGDPIPPSPPTTNPSPPTTTPPTPTGPTTGPTTSLTVPTPPDDGTITYALTFVPAPGVTSNGTGSVTAVLTEATREFTVEGSYEGMTGPERGLHIHTYPSQLDVGSTPGAVPGSGTISRTYILSAAHVEALKAGAFEMNIHTDRFPDGELQGTLRPVANPTPPTTVAPDPTTTLVTPPTPTTQPTPTTPSAPTSTTRPDPGDDPDDGPKNVDGSPKAPKPGTVAPPADAELGMAYGIWEPSEHDTCSKEIHDRYWVYGPDGKVYPTWHPPVDPVSGCTFGHEHGRDPAGSDLSDIPFPFGYVNEEAMKSGMVHRHEDHVGHKIEWYNDGGYYNNGSPSSYHDEVCDVAYKMHQGSHSADAFSNNLHEVFNYARCENGSEFIYRALHPFGNKGEFNMHCGQGAGDAVRFGDATGGPDDTDGRGTREIPAEECFEDRVLVGEGERSNWHAFDERWTLYQNDDSEDFGRFFIQFYFFVDLPSRYWDGTKLARTVDLCYRTGARQVRNDSLCEPMRRANPGRRVQWDDPASPFNGADRSVFMVDIRLDNNAGQTDWYTDIHGSNWSATPFAGAIRQHVGTTPIRAAASYRPSPIRSIDFADDLGLHAPN